MQSAYFRIDFLKLTEILKDIFYLILNENFLQAVTFDA